ncbi:MAG: hypothetical protein ACYTEV_00060 [Planctomycetota bacterium]|jgi:hypothetical protein
MILLPAWFLVGLVTIATAMAAIGAIVLLGLLIRDRSRRSIW